MNKNRSKQFVTAWVMVVGCMLIQAIPFSIASNIQPQFMDYVVKGEGFTLGGFSLIFTISTIIAALVSPLIGKMYSKYNPKMLLIIGAILSGGGFAFFGLANNLWEFYIIGGITQIGTAVVSSIGVPLVVSNWFSEEVRGKALGLTFAGGAFGNMFLQQLTAISLINNGYRKSYFMFGALSIVVGLVVTIFVLRLPRNESEVLKSSKIKDDATTMNFSYSLTDLKNVKYFWFLAIAFILIGLTISAIMIQYPAYMKSAVGLAPALVGSVGSVLAIFSLLGNLVGGHLFDKLGVTKCMICAGTSAAIGSVFLILSSQNQIFAFVFAAFFGASVFSYIMGVAYMTGKFFGKENYGSILGVINLMFAVGFAVGSALFGIVVQRIGYGFLWTTVLVLVIIAYGLIILASIGMKKLNSSRATSR
ncbi:MAG: conjugated bile salt MFS transporter [Sarcina sp.]